VRRTGTSGAYRDFCYDRNGNQTRSFNYLSGTTRTQTWTSDNLPASISENGA
jgi:hypothetical protein